VEEMV
jgi:hypothetical protein